MSHLTLSHVIKQGCSQGENVLALFFFQQEILVRSTFQVHIKREMGCSSDLLDTDLSKRIQAKYI